MHAIQRFKSGNTRLKDYDDLWRLSKSGLKFRRDKLAALLLEKKITPSLNQEWIHPELERMWKNYHSRYDDLPEYLSELFEGVNIWITSVLSKAENLIRIKGLEEV